MAWPLPPPLGRYAVHHWRRDEFAEGAGAASLAAAVKLRDQLRGKTVVCIMSGGNISTDVLRRILNAS